MHSHDHCNAHMIPCCCVAVMMLSWDDVLGVELIDTNAETDVVIADDLVSRGLAQYKTDKSKKDRGIVIVDTGTYTLTGTRTHVHIHTHSILLA